MKDSIEALAFGHKSLGMMVNRFCEDLKPEEYLHRPCPGSNCAAWILGHLTVTDCSAIKTLGGTPPALPEGFEARFSREGDAPAASDFGDVTKLLPLFGEVHGVLIATLLKTPPELLSKPLEKPRPIFSTIGEMASFISHHAAMHVGQITIIRRSLGRPPLI
ncbi:MAG: hypothetical protein DCC75_03115 [Proteobacteria bacterium]|nr:MAG: hypothetical protein DCC75_03115 [Pseudomonadota bacterium]